MSKSSWGIALLAAAISLPAAAQTATDLAALNGLAPVTILQKSQPGKSALSANFTITGGIQTGEFHQPTLLPFAQQQQQALLDAFESTGNLAQLSDGLGTTLGAAWLARAHYVDQKTYTRISPAVTDLIAYAFATSSANSSSGKYFFANQTKEDKTSVSPEALAILTKNGGTADPFGKAYNLPGGSPGADPYGDSRPFQTEPTLTRIAGPDYFNVPSDNYVYTRGPSQNLIDSPSYPSGHTTYGFTGSLLLAILLPERAPQMIARGAEYGNDRILLGAHYTMDVLAGRTLALYDMAHLLANDKAYVGQSFKNKTTIADFPAAVKAARADVIAALAAACGNAVKACAHEDTGRFSNPTADEIFYLSTQTYSLPVVYPNNAAPEDIAKLAPEAGNLLTAAYPSLTLAQADKILTETEGPGGGFLDDGSPFGVYSRLNLFAAFTRAAQLVSAK